MVFVSFYAYWHWIVAGFLSPNQWMILDCYMMSRRGTNRGGAANMSIVTPGSGGINGGRFTTGLPLSQLGETSPQCGRC